LPIGIPAVPFLGPLNGFCVVAKDAFPFLSAKFVWIGPVGSKSLSDEFGPILPSVFSLIDFVAR
jgi:hypothetical protein